MARNMVTKWGLSDKLGPLTYAEESGEVFLGRQVTQHKQVSDETAHVIWNDGSGVNYATSPDRGVTWSHRPRIHGQGGSSHIAVPVKPVWPNEPIGNSFPRGRL